MEVAIPWILLVAMAGLAAFLAFRKEENPYPEAIERLTEELESGSEPEPSRPGDPPELLTLRLALARGWRPAAAGEEDPGERALQGLFRYVEDAVLLPLEQALRDGASGDRLEDAVNALRDLSYYAREAREEVERSENLSALVQAVTREYARETGVPVRFSGPPEALPVTLRPETFKDALYLILSNAGRFGGGETVDVVAEAEGSEIRLRVRDRGPGFSREALDHAFDPFWSTEGDALGLGLTHARRLLEAQGAKVEAGNLEAGGAEAVVRLRRSR